jgi:phage shock protein C
MSLKEIKRSDTDVLIAGICGGLGESTGIPSWIWRIAFVATTIFFGFGFLPYVILWIFMPKPE